MNINIYNEVRRPQNEENLKLSGLSNLRKPFQKYDNIMNIGNIQYNIRILLNKIHNEYFNQKININSNNINDYNSLLSNTITNLLKVNALLEKINEPYTFSRIYEEIIRNRLYKTTKELLKILVINSTDIILNIKRLDDKNQLDNMPEFSVYLKYNLLYSSIKNEYFQENDFNALISNEFIKELI